jgi:hypothetical protein
MFITYKPYPKKFQIKQPGNKYNRHILTIAVEKIPVMYLEVDLKGTEGEK